ncbi:PD-(D/E)XK nuclease family protein [Bacillus sp. PS06]|uniref:PD-(D/E)XK nuclease family protein n=1 Tax=Bacillus sp. PS06 TaxID=2764176 RepID=UPI001784547D|nr:PD-(D/E)XK nuclease family protein [Bacillus sp. PS06]MBD8067914.1 PD-(D/E)XK nuclease family protein [Bacillus sp. PS06]
MKSLIEALHHTCQTNLLKEKILLVDSYSNGEQVISQYMKEGYHAINLKIKTIRDLALASVELHHEYCTPAIGSHLLYKLLKNLKVEQQLQYFHELEVTPALSYGMFEIIQELRLAGYTSETINESQFVTKAKGHDMVHILKGYEMLLHENKLKDDYHLYHEAIQRGNRLDCIYILQSNLSVTYLQEQFLKKIISEHIVHLPLAPVYGVAKPQQTNFSRISEGAATPLSYIYQLQALEDQRVNLNLFSSKTEEQELKQMIGQIGKKKLKFDDCVILYSQSNPYLTTMYHLKEAYHLPVTFSEGIPIKLTRPGKLVTGLLQWIKEGYSVSAFIHLLQEGLIDVGEEGPAKTRWTTLLRKLNIGWNEGRYLIQLQNELRNVEGKLHQEHDAQKHEYLSQLRHDLSWLLEWYQAVFAKLPHSSIELTYRELLLGLQQMIRDFSRISSSYDQGAKEQLLEQIDRILSYSNEMVTLNEGIYRTEELLLQLQVGASRPKPGHLHISSFKNAAYLAREHVFIVGLDNRRFPGGSGENPLLLDLERKKLGNMIPLLQENSKDKLYEMLQVLASSSGHVTMSYCQFDVNENRATSPSHLFLQCYRLQSGWHQADFKKLKRSLPSLDEDIILARDWWIQKLTSANQKVLEQSLLKNYEHISLGIKADEERMKSAFTIFDGKIISDTTMLDPRKNKEKTISAGKLEMLATCPYSYFLQEVLKIKPLEETGFSIDRWLDPPTRGTLLHEIFETFYRKLQDLNERPSVEKHHTLIHDIALNSLATMKETVPPPSEKVELQETAEILESCETFLKIEEENSIHGVPKFFEYSFGVDGIEPAMITLPSGTIHVSGKIDRVDLQNDETYHIIDYKTGSTWGYDGHTIFRGGRQLQHMLYTLAIENHLSLDEGVVQKSSYLFPTKKGLGQVFEREQEESIRTNGRDILENLLTVIEHGHFTMTDDENDCRYCQLKDVCRRSTYDKEQMELIHQDHEATGVRRFKGVRAYD